MIFAKNQNWQTSRKPFSLALANTVNTGTSISFPSGAIANTQWWARRGFQGYGPRIQYPGGAGMDGLRSKGMGCGCGCGGHGGCGDNQGFGQGLGSLLCLAGLALAAYWIGKRNGVIG